MLRARVFYYVPKIIGIGVFLVCLTSALIPELRKQVRSNFIGQKRSVLSVLRDVKIGERRVDVVKVRDASGLLIEVYDRTDGHYTLIDQTRLSDSTDAFFVLNGQSSNLFVADLDNDGDTEVASPSYDRNLVAHLNIFSLREFENKIEIVQGP